MSNRLLFAAALDTGEPDPRQRRFRAVMTGLSSMTSAANHTISMIGMEGFRASQVDLGWLSEEILDYVRTVPDCDPGRLAALIKAELPQVVQRLKAFSVSTTDWPEVISLSFETKDDLGTYTYSVSVPTGQAMAS